MKILRLRAVLFVARLLKVPIELNYSFWADLKNDAKMSGVSTDPKKAMDMSLGSNATSMSLAALNPADAASVAGRTGN